MEKLRLTLWDFFTFFMTGVFACLLILAYLLLRTQVSLDSIEGNLSKISGATTVAGFVIAATLVGMIVEPFANFFDRFLNRHIKNYEDKHKYALDKDDTEIKDRLCNDIRIADGLTLANLYFYAKDYVEQYQLAPNLITFLSRYGFYRNASLITLVGGFGLTVTSPSFYGVVAWGLGTILSFAAFKYRGDQFLSYMAPMVYRTALIHRLRGEKGPAGTTKTSAKEESGE